MFNNIILTQTTKQKFPLELAQIRKYELEQNVTVVAKTLYLNRFPARIDWFKLAMINYK